METEMIKPGMDIYSRTLTGLRARKAKRERDKSREIFYNAMIEYIEAPIKAREQGKPFGWCQVQAPAELFYAMDIAVLYPEHFSLIMASQGLEIPFIEAAEMHHLKDLCSVEKIFIGALPNERIRLGWLNAQPYSFLPFLDEMEKEFGAIVVTDNLSCGWLGGDGADGPLFYCNPEDPVRSLAAKGLSHYGSNCYKDADRFSKVVIRMAKNYKLDGVVFSAHWGCKNICAISKHIREDLMEATGISMLILESDCLDQRTNWIPQMMSLTREYMEMLNQRKA